MPSPNNTEELAIELFERLTDDINIDLPTIDWDNDFSFPYGNDSACCSGNRSM